MQTANVLRLVAKRGPDRREGKSIPSAQRQRALESPNVRTRINDGRRAIDRMGATPAELDRTRETMLRAATVREVKRGIWAPVC